MPRRATKKKDAPPPPPPQPSPDSEWEDEDAYTEQIKNWLDKRGTKPFVVEKSLDPQVDAIFGITPLFAHMGWESIFSFKGTFIPPLVHEFYAHIDYSQSSTTSFTTSVQDQQIVVTPTLLNELFGIPNNGQHFIMGKVKDDDGSDQKVPSIEPKWRREQCLEKLDIPIERIAGNKERIYCKRMEIKARLVAYFIQFNVVPRSDTSILDQRDLYILDKLLFGFDAPLPLATMILDSILNVARPSRNPRCPVFPILITQLIIKLGIDVSGFPKVPPTSVDMVDFTKLSFGFHYTNNGGHWDNRNRLNRYGEQIPETRLSTAGQEDAHNLQPPRASTSSSRPREGRTITNEFLLEYMDRQERRFDDIQSQLASIVTTQQHILERQDAMMRQLGRRDDPSSP